MFTFKQLTTFALLAVAISASTIPEIVRRSAADASCANPSVVSTESFAVGDKVVEVTTLSCAKSEVEGRAVTTARTNTNVCTASCTTSCNQLTGILPPTSDDCDIIEQAILIFHGHQSDTFTVQPNHVLTLSQGTCSYFFSNDGSNALDSCWASLSANGKAAGAACFPPHQPFFPEGVCKAPTWSVGATHS